MAEFSLNGREFRTGKLDALTQLAIAVKLMPIIPALQPVMAAVAEQRAASVEADRAVIAGVEPPAGPAPLDLEAVGRLGMAMNALPDEGRNYIIGACLSVVLGEAGGGFLPVWNASLKAPDASLDLVTMLQLVYRVVMDNIASFSNALGSTSLNPMPGAL